MHTSTLSSPNCSPCETMTQFELNIANIANKQVQINRLSNFRNIGPRFSSILSLIDDRIEIFIRLNITDIKQIDIKNRAPDSYLS